MIPISKWEDLTGDKEVIKVLQEVYGDDVEKMDLQVGLHAEKKIKGFAISETAFFIFLLIASRYILFFHLKSVVVGFKHLSPDLNPNWFGNY